MRSPVTVEDLIMIVNEKFRDDPKIGKMFEKCFSNTLNTTVKKINDGTTFVITGDIPAMWLRDSVCQIRPYLILAQNNTEIADMIAGLVARQVDFILKDPYANAFNEFENGAGHQDDRTDMKPYIWERKYEIDSLCFPIQLSYLYWKNTGRTDILQRSGNLLLKLLSTHLLQNRIMKINQRTSLKDRIVLTRTPCQEMEREHL